MNRFPTLAAVVVLCAACAPARSVSTHAEPVTPSAAEAAFPDEVRAYLDSALMLMETRALRRRHVDWPAFRQELYDATRGATRLEELHLPLAMAARQLGDNHSMFLPSPTSPMGQMLVAATSAQPAVHPHGRTMGEAIGYLWLPGASAEPVRAAAYADSLAAALGRLGAAGACAWVVDLRDNTGGNVWPMLAGLGPLLGADTTGWFVDADGGRTPWGYRDGASWMQERTMQRVSVRVSEDRFAAAAPATLLPVAVITGPRTASSGEAVAVAFQGRALARFFGEPTAGLATSNTNFAMSDGATLVLTTAVFADRHGREAVGALVPDVVVRGGEGDATGEDAVLRPATRWIGKVHRTACAAG